jgi:hypothetical protein
MNDDDLGRAYAAAREQRRLQRREPLPSPETLQSLVDGRVASADRDVLLERALASGAADELALLHSVAAGIEAERAPLVRPWKAWWPVAAAAALVLAVGVPTFGRWRDGHAPPRFRASRALAGPQLALPASNEPVRVDQTFVWARLDLAREYTLELMNDSGRTIARIVTTDTTATLPRSVSENQRVHLSGWWVSATMTDGSQRRSEMRLLRAATTK